MGILLRAYDKTGAALGLLPHFSNLQYQVSDDGGGSLTFEYLRSGLNASLLDRDELIIGTVEEVTTQTTYFMLEDDEDDPSVTVKDQQTLTVAARPYMGVLEQAVVYPPGHNAAATNLYGLKDQKVFADKSPGHIMLLLINEAKARGCFPELVTDFVTATDSAGRAWPKVYDISYPIGTNYMQVLSDMVQDGWVDARMDGRTLRLFVPDTYFGQKQIILNGGRNVKRSPRKRSRRGIYSHILGAGDAEKKAAVQVANATTLARFGRREGFAADGRMTNRTSLTSMAQRELNKNQQQREGFSLDMILDAPPGEEANWPRPGVDFSVGDRIYFDRYRKSDTELQSLVVRSMTWQWGNRDAAPTCTIEVNDLFVKGPILLGRKVAAITGGSTTTKPPVPTAPAPDRIAPAAPSSVSVDAEVALYTDQERPVYRCTATVSWPAVALDGDGGPLDDLAGHEVSVRHNGGAWGGAKAQKDLQDEYPDLRPGDTFQARVNSFDLTGNRSAWKESAVLTLPNDTQKPPAPGAPGLSTKLGVVTAKWLGKSATDGPMPEDFLAVELQRSKVTTFPAPVEVAGRIGDKDESILITGQPYGELWHYRWVAIDIAGNRSDPGPYASIATEPTAKTDIAADVIDQIDQAITDAGTAAQAAADAKAVADAAATQEALDSAVSDLDTAIGAAEDRSKTYADTIVATAANGINQVYMSTLDPSGTDYVAGDMWRKYDTLGNGGRLLGEWTFTMPGAVWTTKVYTGAVLTELDADTIVFGQMSGQRIRAGTLEIGATAGLQTSLDTALTASDGVDATNSNPSFAAWADPAKAPSGWTNYSTGPTRESALARTAPYAARFNCTDKTTLRGLLQTQVAGNGLDALPVGTEYVTLTFDVMLNSGPSFSGMGVLFDWITTGFDSSKYRAFMRFDQEVPAPVPGKWYRIQKVLRRPVEVAGGVQTGWQFYLMANYSSALGAMTVKDVIVNRAAVRAATVQEVKALNSADAATVTALSQRGADLVTNGNASTGTNLNFSAFELNSDAPVGVAQSFVAPNVRVNQTDALDELIPVNASKTYELGAWIRNLGTAPSKFYLRAWFYDAAGNQMARVHHSYRAASEATLAAPLNPGDTTMKIAGGIASWQECISKNEPYYYRYINFYDYVDPFGHKWAPFTYTRENYMPTYNATTLNFTAVAADGTVTLNEPYNGPARPVGVSLAIGQGGDTSTYSWALGLSVPSEWTYYKGTLRGVQTGNALVQTAASSPFPFGAAQIRIALLHNYMTGTDIENHICAIAGVSVSEAAAALTQAAAAQATADGVVTLTNGWRVTGKTTINGGVLENDSIKTAALSAGSVGARQLTVADTSNMAEVNETTEGIVAYGGWTHKVEVVNGVRWSTRDTTTANTYFMFRNQVGPLPFAEGDRVRLTFEAYADAVNTLAPRVWWYGGTSGSASLTPVDGSPTIIGTTPQKFALEGDLTGVDPLSVSYLLGLGSVASGRTVRVRNVRAYVMNAGQLLVDGSVEAKHVKTKSLTANEIQVDTLIIGQGQVDGLDDELAGKETPSGAQAKANAAQSAAITAAAADAKSKADAAQAAATTAAASDAKAKADAAELAAKQAAALDAKAKADAAEGAAKTAAAADAKSKADAAQAAAITAAASDAKAKADAAELAAKQAAALDATEKANAAQSAAITAAAADAKSKADAAKAAAITAATTAAASDAQARADAAKAAALTAAAADAKAKADAAEGAAKTAAAADAKSKADAAQAAAITAAASDAKAKADAAELAAKQAAALDASGKASAAQSAAQGYADTQYGPTKTRVNNWTAAGKTTINGGVLETDTVDAISLKARTIGVEKLAIAGMTNTIPNGAGEFGGKGGWIPATSSMTWDTVDKPAGFPGAFRSAPSAPTLATTRMEWDVEPGAQHLVEMWVKANKPNSRMSIEVRDQSGALGVDCYPVADEAFALNDVTTMPLNNCVVPTVWTKYVCLMVAKPTTTKLYVSSIFFNQSTGTERGATQSIVMRSRIKQSGRLIVDGSIEAQHLAVNSVKADAIEVGALDGQVITGAVIRTADNGQPRVEMSTDAYESELKFYTAKPSEIAPARMRASANPAYGDGIIIDGPDFGTDDPTQLQIGQGEDGPYFNIFTQRIGLSSGPVNGINLFSGSNNGRQVSLDLAADGVSNYRNPDNIDAALYVQTPLDRGATIVTNNLVVSARNSDADNGGNLVVKETELTWTVNATQLIKADATGVAVRNLKDLDDTGWVNVTKKSGYDWISPTETCQVRRKNGVVYIRGGFGNMGIPPYNPSNRAGTVSQTVATLPTWAWPPKNFVNSCGTQEGSASATAFISAGGDIIVRPNTVSSGYYFFTFSWLVD